MLFGLTNISTFIHILHHRILKRMLTIQTYHLKGLINVATIRTEMDKCENHQEELTGVSDRETAIKKKVETKMSVSSI